MSQLQTLILAIGAVQGVLLFVLLITDKRVNYASKVLGTYCLLLATTLVLPIIASVGGGPFAFLIGFLVFLPACYGAFAYLYCRSAMTGASITGADAIHMLPLLACYALNYPVLFSAEQALSFVSAPQNTLSYGLTVVIFYGQAIAYALLLVRTIYRYQTKAKHALSSYNPDTFKWHWTLAVFMVLIWGLKVLSLIASSPTVVNLIADCLLVILIYFFAVAQWRNPSLFHVQQLNAELLQPTVASDKTRAEDKKSPDGLLDEQTRSTILSLVQDQVTTKALFRNNELTLATLAEQVGVSVHHLSETLNQYGGKNFNRFINEFRVAEVCEQLAHNNDRNLIDLAMDAGFSSKSSFNAIFKKLTGKTPSVYRRQLADQG